MNDPLDEIDNDVARTDYASAYKRCSDFLAENPDHPRATFLLGRILAENGKGREAFTLFDQAQQLGHSESETLAQQALCLIRNAQPQEALLFADRAERLQPANASALFALGVVYSRTERHAEATKFYLAAIAAEPRVANFRFSLAVNQQALGNVAAARKAYRACLDLEPENFRALAAWAHITRMGRDDIAQMETLFPAAKAASSPIALLRLGHALAKACDDTGQPAEAIAWLKLAKSSLLAQRQSHTEKDAALFRAVASGLSMPPAPGFDKIAPIFVVGLPRTGTTLLDRILSSHSLVESIGESRATTWTLRDLLQDRAKIILSADAIETANALDPRLVGETYSAHIGWTPHRTTRPVDMMPLNFFFLPLLRRALPNARFLCLRRHPADTVLNNYRHLLENRWGHYDYAYGLASTARYFVHFDQLMKACQRELPSDRFCFVEYESLVSNLDQTVRQVLSFCNLEFEQSCVHFHSNPNPVSTPSALQVREPIHAASVGRWRQYAPYVSEALDVLSKAGLIDQSGHAGVDPNPSS